MSPAALTRWTRLGRRAVAGRRRPAARVEFIQSHCPMTTAQPHGPPCDPTPALPARAHVIELTPEQRALQRLRRLLALHERMLDRVRGIEIFERAAIVFHGGEGTAEDFRLLQVHSQPHSRMLVRHATKFVRAISRTRLWIAPILPRLALLRPNPRISSDFPGASAASAAWTAVEILARELNGARRCEQHAEAGVFRAGDHLTTQQSVPERWEYEVRRNGAVSNANSSQPGDAETASEEAERRHAEIVREVAAAPICWPDLAQLLALLGKQCPAGAFWRLNDELAYEALHSPLVDTNTVRTAAKSAAPAAGSSAPAPSAAKPVAPRRLIRGWAAILKELGLPASRNNRRLVRDYAVRNGSPIKLAKRTVTVFADLLVPWWNSVLNATEGDGSPLIAPAAELNNEHQLRAAGMHSLRRPASG